MRAVGVCKTIAPMTGQTASSRLTLLEDRRAASAELSTARVRRYRLARVQVGGHPAPFEKRFEYLKRTYD
jgi:hypothetical protein